MWAESEQDGDWTQRTSERVNYGYMTGSNKVRVSRKSGVYYIIRALQILSTAEHVRARMQLFFQFLPGLGHAFFNCNYYIGTSTSFTDESSRVGILWNVAIWQLQVRILSSSGDNLIKIYRYRRFLPVGNSQGNLLSSVDFSCSQ